MRISTVRLPLLAMAIAILVASCSDTSTSIEEPKTVSELISKAGEIPVAPARSEADLGIVEERVTEGGEQYVSKSKRRRLQNRFEELIAFGASADVIYPGSILQGKSLIGGQLTPISAPIKAVTLTLQGGVSLNVDSPSYAAVDAAIVKLAVDSEPAAADLKYFMSSMHSTESSFLNMGLDVNWLIGSIRGKFESQRGVKRSSTLLYMKQVYFKVVCSKPAFTDDVTVSQLVGSIGSGNPPCYISSVDYGRIFLIRVTADTTQEALDNAIEASYGMFSGSGGFGNLNLNVTTTFDAIILGGSANGRLTQLRRERCRRSIS
ncbi:MAG: thiol-activated cytolysin family protein [Ignavibacteria bacterium]|nr:thiol-activated cytolysin family protein [Ignavibacteria bacterium]